MKKQKGVVLISTITLLYILLVTGIALVSLAIITLRYMQKAHLSAQALNIAEGGIDKAVWSLNHIPHYSGEENTPLGEGKFSISIQDIGSEKIIESTAQIPNIPPYLAQKKIRVRVTPNPQGEGISFRYAVQVGEGGLRLNSNSRINGNVSSNGSITGDANSEIRGEARANGNIFGDTNHEIYGDVYAFGNISGEGNYKIFGDAYATGTISDPPEVEGDRYPNQDPSNLPPIDPLPTINYDYWKAQANVNNDPYLGDLELNSQSLPLGPKKIEGNLTLTNSSLTLTGPIHVTGNFEMNSNSHLYLDEDFRSNGTVLIVDGTIRINSNAIIHPTSADPKGYILLVTTSSSSPAIEINSNSSGGVYYALEGTLQINSNGDVVAIVAKQLILNANAELNYDEGLASAYFSTGPGGSWIIKRGSWEIFY